MAFPPVADARPGSHNDDMTPEAFLLQMGRDHAAELRRLAGPKATRGQRPRRSRRALVRTRQAFGRSLIHWGTVLMHGTPASACT